MGEGLFVPIPTVPKSSEVRSLIEQIERQYITGGERLQNLVKNKFQENQDKDAKKIFNKREFMQAQRDYTWEKWRASNFIVSVMFQESIPEIRLYRKDDRDQYKKCLDGQQRLTTLWMFINDKFPLDMSKADFSKFPVGDQIYSVKADLHGKLFSQLPQEWQDSILNYSFNIIIYNNCSDAQAERIYTKMANGTKPLKAIEIRKAAMGIDVRNFVYDLLESPWALHMMTSASALGSRGIDVISQLLVLINKNGAIELSKENIDEVIYNYRDFGLPEEIRTSTIAASDYMNQVLDRWIEIKKVADEEVTKGRKVKKYSTYRFPLFKNKTIVIMFMWAAYRAQQEQIDVDKFQKWAFEFFQKPSEKFRLGLADGKTKAGDYDNVKLRIDAIEEEIARLK